MFILNNRGFSLSGVLTSMIAFGIIALAAQSLIVTANQFISQQDGHFSSIESANHLKANICQRVKWSPTMTMDTSRLYYKELTPSGLKYIRKGGSSPPQIASVGLFSNGLRNIKGTDAVTGHPAVNTFVNGLTLSDRVKGGGGKLLKIYSDSHTLVSYQSVGDVSSDSSIENIQGKGLGYLKKENEGLILASRCVAHGEFRREFSEGSVLDETDIGTYRPEFAHRVGLYILEGLKFRPFHFPDPAVALEDRILCCPVVGTDNITKGTSACKGLDEMTPVTYAIRIDSEGLKDAALWTSSTDRQKLVVEKFKEDIITPAQITGVKEYPLIQSDNRFIYASGFMVSTFEHLQNSFQVNFLEIQNKCETASAAGFCPTVDTRVNPELITFGTPERSILSYLNVETSLCKFRYRSMSTGGGFLSLGSSLLSN